jgi:hypothetical protein
MLNRILAVNAALIVALATACAPATFNPIPAYDSNLITFDQLESVRNRNAFEAISAVRPSFLRSRGPTTLMGTSAEYATVYVDGMRYGSLEMLRQIPAAWIKEVRLYRVSSSGNFSPQEFGGVLAITTRTH